MIRLSRKDLGAEWAWSRTTVHLWRRHRFSSQTKSAHGLGMRGNAAMEQQRGWGVWGGDPANQGPVFPFLLVRVLFFFVLTEGGSQGRKENAGQMTPNPAFPPRSG